jgi:hypothetical protein
MGYIVKRLGSLYSIPKVWNQSLGSTRQNGRVGRRRVWVLFQIGHYFKRDYLLYGYRGLDHRVKLKAVALKQILD